MKSRVIILFCVVTLAAFTVSCASRVKHQGKRHAPMGPMPQWMAMQNEGPAAPVMAPHFQTVQCDQPMQAIGKRSASLQALDSFPSLSRYYLNEENSDVHLVVNGTRLPAHKFVLSAKNHKFAELFRSDPTKTDFDMGPVSEDLFKIMLKYFYTESFDMDSEGDYDKAVKVFELANEWDAYGLKALVERQLAKLINMDNFIEFLKFAEDNQMHELIKLWMSFVWANSQQIISEEKFANETNGVIVKVLSALNAPGHYLIAKIQNMMAMDPSLRSEDVRPIIRVERVSVEDLIALGQMGLFDYQFLFDDMVKRYRTACIQPVRRTVVLPWRPITNVNVIPPKQ